jgi:hypothetical protein
MRAINKVIVPVDFLKNTDKLIGDSINMAENFSAVIHFVHIVTFPNGDAC